VTQKEKEGGIRAYPPLMITFMNSKHGSKFGKKLFCEILCKDIDNLIIGWTILYFNNTIMNDIFMKLNESQCVSYADAELDICIAEWHSDYHTKA